MITFKAVILAASCFAALALSMEGSFAAEEAVVNFAGEDPSEDDIIDALTPKITRGISPGAIGSVAGSVGASVSKASFDQIVFELNSDRIAPRARGILDKIGRALQSEELGNLGIVIEGHTDASGAFDYNMRLSTRRAEAVKRYLIENFDVEAARLQTVGKGPTDLLDKQNPRNGANRRVVFVAKVTNPNHAER